MDRSKRNAGAMPGLHDDPLVEILSRVPAKSVCRFKCVSKAWRDLIADPNNRKKLPQPMQGFFYTTQDDPKIDHFSFGFIGLTATSVPQDIDPCFSFLTELPGIQALDLRASCNGLILFEHRRQELYSHALGYIVCNPTTKQWRAVHTCGCPPQRILSFTRLAFDPAASSHFHVVQFWVDTKNSMSVHSYSSETGTWNHNQIGGHDKQGQLDGWQHQVRPTYVCPWTAFVNGVLHLIVQDQDQPHHKQLIVAIDAQGKTRKIINVPDLSNVGFWAVCYFGQSQGSLYYMILELLNIHDYKLWIWVLQDYDTQEWVLKDTLTSLELNGDESCRGCISDFDVAGIHQDRNVVFFTFSGFKLIAYDLERKEASVAATFKGQKRLTRLASCVPYFAESPSLTNKH